ncbi:MAG: YqzL family protein [Firmicutes bacterium]|nr:YqzL family protein [Bacillota bacterium]
MEIKTILWKAFMYTGNIETYLLYKGADTDANIYEKNGKEELVWQTSKPEALS